MHRLAVAPPSLSALARYPVAFPLAAIAAGALVPAAAEAAHAALPPFVTLLVALAVLATEMTPPSRREAGTALLMLLATAAPGFLAVLAVTKAVDLPHDLALPASLIAASPVAISCGVVSQRFGLPARPAVWAAMLGVVAGPMVLPAAAALCGAAGLLDPADLAYRAALRGALPALAAFAIRRAAPRAVAARLPELRGATVLVLLPLGLAAGGGLHTAAAAGNGAAAIVVAIGTLALCTVMASLLGLLVAGGQNGLALALAGAARNVSVAWAASIEVLPPRADLVFAVALAASFAMPGALRAAMFVAARAQLLGAGRRLLPWHQRRNAVRPVLLALGVLAVPASVSAEPPPVLAARVIAVGIQGAGAVSAVGAFLPGGPIHDKPDFAASTRQGRILDPTRVLIASSSNFGAPTARAGESEGSVLSIAPEGETIAVPPDFARTTGQAAALNGRVQLFTAQSPAFLNGVNTPGAVTADLPPVGNPLGISINNGFGRLWFANAPRGAAGAGTLSIVDPGGQPLAGAPSRLGGGVFAGELTGRQPRQLIPGGLGAGAVATALLGMSPDGSKRAVFAVLTADGALAQAHSEQAMDGLAPPGTVGDMARREASAVQPVTLRAGMAFNWVPDRILYVTDPTRNALLALKLADDGQVFRVAGVRTIAVPALDLPVDLAPAVPEMANPTLASNTTLAGGSDLYIVNRGNGTLMRLRQDGTVLAVRRVSVEGAALGAGRLNGIAVSPDAQRLWVTVSGGLPGHEGAPGALLEVPAFGPGRAASLVERGRALFQTVFTPAEGLGPLFNGRSCLECHGSPASGGAAAEGTGFVLRVGRRVPGGGFDPLAGQGGPVARAHSVAELGEACALVPGIPAAANVISVRGSPALFGVGMIETIPDEAILAAAARNGTRGRPNLVRDAEGHERVGRFGWKADTATLEQFVADAFRNELGITSPLAPVDLVAPAPGCDAGPAPKDDGGAVRAVSAYVRSLPPPSPSEPPRLAGQAVFARAGCDACHVPALPDSEGEPVPLYSDLLLHDMGPTLDDGVPQGAASGGEWRTALLSGLGARRRFLHDGRAASIAAAILAHDGEGTKTAEAFRHLPPEQREKLLAFLGAL